MSADDLLGRAQSLLDSLREKGLHLPNPTRVDGDTDAIAALAEEVRTLARAPEIVVVAAFDASGTLSVRAAGAVSSRAAIAEVRTFAPWREGATVRRAPLAGGIAAFDGVERDGPINVVLVDAAGVPLAWRTIDG